mmetsp:Transcript_46241/g.122642  ORF Transcript_46241/g.122642 Transcript_46241/m.122642 type:complete len:232 (+) Transcript_46241:1698-2393(+)
MQGQWRPHTRPGIQRPLTEGVPLALHLDDALASSSKLGATGDHPRHAEVLVVRDLSQELLKPHKIRTGFTVDGQDDRVGSNVLTEDEASLCNVHSFQGDVVFLRCLVRHIMEDAEPYLYERAGHEMVQVKHLENNFDSFTPSAHRQGDMLAHCTVKGDIKQHEIHTRLPSNFQQHVARLKRVGGGTPRDAPLHLQHAARRSSLRKRSALWCVSNHLFHELLGDAEPDTLWE